MQFSFGSLEKAVQTDLCRLLLNEKKSKFDLKKIQVSSAVTLYLTEKLNFIINFRLW